MPTIKCKYKFGDTLYIKNDPEQNPYMFVGLIHRPTGIIYEISFVGEVSEVYDFETSETKDQFMTLGIEDKTDNTETDGE